MLLPSRAGRRSRARRKGAGRGSGYQPAPRLGHAWSVIGALVVELHFPTCRSLKDKRAVLRPVIDGARSRFAVAVAETDYQDLHQRSILEVAAAAASERVVVETLDAVERFIWSRPDLEVVGATRRWLDDD